MEYSWFESPETATTEEISDGAHNIITDDWRLNMCEIVNIISLFSTVIELKAICTVIFP